MIKDLKLEEKKNIHDIRIVYPLIAKNRHHTTVSISVIQMLTSLFLSHTKASLDGEKEF